VGQPSWFLLTDLRQCRDGELCDATQFGQIVRSHAMNTAIYGYSSPERNAVCHIQPYISIRICDRLHVDVFPNDVEITGGLCDATIKKRTAM